ncbi:hypothetical protein GL50803_0015873 [Giardia duodenalis]|uniref:Uncharacterized protein n=1 Tax=Giardia intestinalis (strain ATCC 50803 / WB clone C6) TaxID=184922 RepID=D3KHL2_GIAIC|nr:hypothetical protein GL50803_0015873 [Giardia intestinalis]KAE8304030.1 hypothetical protein GL50803_0015873 [Giardia intestinalis]
MVPVPFIKVKVEEKLSRRNAAHEPPLNCARSTVATASSHKAHEISNGRQHSSHGYLFSSRLAASTKGRVPVVPYSADAIAEYNSIKMRPSKANHSIDPTAQSSPINRATVFPKTYASPVGVTLRPQAQCHERSPSSIVCQPISKQTAPTILATHMTNMEKIKEHEAFIMQSPLSQVSQIFKPSVELRCAALDAQRSRSDILHSALCNIISKNYHSRRVQNAAMLFLEIGGFSPRILANEMKHYKKNRSSINPNAARLTCNVEESATSLSCSTFSEIAPAHVIRELSAPVFSETDNTDTVLDGPAFKDVKRLSHVWPNKAQPKSSVTCVATEKASLTRLQSDRFLQSSSTGCLLSRKRHVEYRLLDAALPPPKDLSSSESELSSSSDLDLNFDSLVQKRRELFSRSFSLPKKGPSINKQPLLKLESMTAKTSPSSFVSPSRKATSDYKSQPLNLVCEEHELRQVAKDAKLRKARSFGEFSTSRRRKSKVTHFIPDFSCFKSSSSLSQSVSVISELNEYYSINEKLGYVEAIGRSVSNQCKAECSHTYLSNEEAQHMLTLLYRQYYADCKAVDTTRRYRGLRRIHHHNTYPYQIAEEGGHYNTQSNDYSLIEAILTHVQQPVSHSYGVSHSIISYCNASLHECRMGTLFETLSLARSFLYIVDFHLDMDTYFPQVLALMLQEHSQRAQPTFDLMNDPPCILSADNPVINKTEIPILKIRSLFVDLSNSGLMDRAATVLNDCVNKRFFDLYMLFTIQSFADSFSDINIWEVGLSWELAFKLCYRILFANEDSHPIISWTPYGDVSYLISLAVFTGRCADGIFNIIDCKESLLYTLILNYSIYEATYILLSTYKRYEDRHSPSISETSPSASSAHPGPPNWQTGSIFEIFTADLPIQFTEQYAETSPSIGTHFTTFQWLIGLQITIDFRLFEALGLLIQNSHISILLSNLRRLKFLLILLIHLLHGYVLSNIHTPGTQEYTDPQPVIVLKSGKLSIKDPFLVTNLLYAIGSILGILLDKKLAQEQLKLSLLSSTAEKMNPETKEAIYDLTCLQSYCIRMLLLLLPYFLDDKELDLDSEVREYGLTCIYASPSQDLYGLVPPYILLHDIRHIYGRLDFILPPESLPAQHIILKHYCAGFLIRTIRSAISFNTISDLDSLSFMRNPLCLSVFWALRKQPFAAKYNLTHWYIDKFTQMTDRNFI